MAEKEFIMGATETGDAGTNLTWFENYKSKKCNAALLISKNLTDDFIDKVISAYIKGYNLIIHATCTGWGGSVMEPNVPEPEIQLSQVKKLIDKGFPAENIVIRIDPIIDIYDGLDRMENVIKTAIDMGLIPGSRVRLSVMDNYPHVRKRFEAAGLSVLYNGYFTAPDAIFRQIGKILEPYAKRYNMKFETCAETKFYGNIFENIGCASQKDLDLLGIPTPKNMPESTQRSSCRCMKKTQILNVNGLHPCKHKCLYCYWKD